MNNNNNSGTVTTINNDEDEEDDGGFGKNTANLGEQSSLARNRLALSEESQQLGNQLPILNLAAISANNSPQSSVDVNFSPSIRQSTRIPHDKRFESLNEYTTSAHEFLTQSISQNQLNHIDSSNESTKNLNSPSK